ncbi:MAG: hypothetical protein WCR46_22220 [Deltaproteobacteria bacterium]
MVELSATKHPHAASRTPLLEYNMDNRGVAVGFGPTKALRRHDHTYSAEGCSGSGRHV